MVDKLGFDLRTDSPTEPRHTSSSDPRRLRTSCRQRASTDVHSGSCDAISSGGTAGTKDQQRSATISGTGSLSTPASGFRGCLGQTAIKWAKRGAGFKFGSSRNCTATNFCASVKLLPRTVFRIEALAVFIRHVSISAAMEHVTRTV